MSFQLRLDEMLCVLQDMKHPWAAELILAVERLGDEILNVICAELDVLPGTTTFDMGSVAAPVFASDFRQELPAVIGYYDSEDEWGPKPSMRLQVSY